VPLVASAKFPSNGRLYREPLGELNSAFYRCSKASTAHDQLGTNRNLIIVWYHVHLFHDLSNCLRPSTTVSRPQTASWPRQARANRERAGWDGRALGCAGLGIPPRYVSPSTCMRPTSRWTRRLGAWNHSRSPRNGYLCPFRSSLAYPPLISKTISTTTSSHVRYCRQGIQAWICELPFRAHHL
jgi:hypothetical protein